MWHSGDSTPGLATRIVGFTIMGVLVAAAVLIGVIQIVDAQRPVLWGTFTEGICEPRAKGGCQSVGSFISDDGSTRLHDVYLEGVPEQGGVARAIYRRDEFFNTSDRQVVHTERESQFAWTLPFGLFVGGVGLIVYYARKWAD